MNDLNGTMNITTTESSTTEVIGYEVSDARKDSVPADPGKINPLADEDTNVNHVQTRLLRRDRLSKASEQEVWLIGRDLTDLRLHPGSSRRFIAMITDRLGMNVDTAYRYMVVYQYTSLEEIEGMGIGSSVAIANGRKRENKAKSLAQPKPNGKLPKPADKTAPESESENETVVGDNHDDEPPTDASADLEPEPDSDGAVAEQISLIVQSIRALTESVKHLRTSRLINKTDLNSALADLAVIVKHVNDLA